MIGHLVGAGELDQAYHRLMRSLKIGLVVTVISVAIVVFAGPHLMGVFTSDRVILATAGHLFFGKVPPYGYFHKWIGWITG